jgi:hypothetical protein
VATAAVTFLAINPLVDVHGPVVPIEEVDHWIDAAADLRRPHVRRHPGERHGRKSE